MPQEWPQVPPGVQSPGWSDRVIDAGGWVILTVVVTLLVVSLVGVPWDAATMAALDTQYADMAEENAHLIEEIERLLEPALPALALESCELTNVDPGFPGWDDPLRQHGRTVDYLLTQTMSEATCTRGASR